MVKLIKKCESVAIKEGAFLKTLEKELIEVFGITELSVYRLERHEEKLVLHPLWGKNDQSKLLLSMLDQFLKEGTNYFYLESKLLIYSNMTVFDLQFD